MDADGLLRTLSYDNSRSFLDESRWHEVPEHAHVFRRTAVACAAPRVGGRFRGVYMLGVDRTADRGASTPVVYLCQADNLEAADQIHRLAWNQSTAPFVIVHTPLGVRLYSGFDYDPDPKPSGSQRGVLAACIAFNKVASQLDAFCATQIDNGTLWAKWGKHIRPNNRVDVRLLKNLKDLGEWLQLNSGLDPEPAHALIGRFVYLRYLRDRGILSDARLSSWGLEASEVFGRNVRLSSFHHLIDQVDEWLNGSIFPLYRTGDGAPKEDDVKLVAGAISGDDVETGQYHLDFRAYDFSHIPIELLSSIYEQFMLIEGKDKESGAYYTPLPLVNFVLGELDDLHPLEDGMKVFDPSCGSGAFLVQCYQLLIEKRRQKLGGPLSPRELRDILLRHIFGLDKQGGACRVAEFSLALALLDQIPAAVLARTHNFKLPSLHKNIFAGDFFDPDASWPKIIGDVDWIVGNPPWFPAKADVEEHELVHAWIEKNRKKFPVANNQAAEAFAWKATFHLRTGSRPGVVAFVMPAMSLFTAYTSFRRRFFRAANVYSVANLSNLRRVLFHGTEHPAAVMFYGHLSESGDGERDSIYVYSPFVANQEANRPSRRRQQNPVWTITVSHSEVRSVRHGDVVDGDILPWKVAMWGGSRDLRLLQRTRRFPSLADLESDGKLVISAGLELRTKMAKEPVERLPQVAGKPFLEPSLLKNCKHIHSFPVLKTVPKSRAFVRLGRGELPLTVCYPPHVIVGAARNYSVYSADFLVVPPRSALGIVSKEANAEPFLRALALYIGSTFVEYHQFLVSPQEGIRSGRSTLTDLRSVPVPFSFDDALQPWTELHHEIVAASDERWRIRAEADAGGLTPQKDFQLETVEERLTELQRHVDDLVFDALQLRPQDRWLVEDLVKIRLGLTDGKVEDVAVRRPEKSEMMAYAKVLRNTLDVFLGRDDTFNHTVTVQYSSRAGVVQIGFGRFSKRQRARVVAVDACVATFLDSMRDRIDTRDHQWLYFDRNLALYAEESVFLFKPMQRFWWTRSQALNDADRVIADLVSDGGVK